MALDDLGEFGVIARIKELFAGLDPAEGVGIGDDCAVLPRSEGVSSVVTTDLLVEDIHFLRDKITPRELGYKSLAVNLSDVAAMGATPTVSFLSLALPQQLDLSWVSEFMAGYYELSAKYDVALMGGDTTRSGDKITISVTAMGEIPTQNLKLRNALSKNDILLVTGELGDSSKGLQDILSGVQNSSYIVSHNRIEPCVKEGIWLGKERGVHAMMDISDGVASDLMHMLRASNCGAQIHCENIPTKHSLELALCGGEDYQLLFSVAPEQVCRLQSAFQAEFNRPLYPIGRVVEGEPCIEWLDHGQKITPSWSGFTHF